VLPEALDEELGHLADERRVAGAEVDDPHGVVPIV
jgi:hypothetical protein